ncbi:ABC transporter ATP-binding protein [Aminirod propionatiphilus]|uniref:ABC transporter ATP-binding protein n=1 Tax=Aminirod propionatiphilus TaxID=3415223 RepID=A0ACD1DYK9_9BACT|nr:ABC transporter ATP-binding protein [Synergistota bacterium]
MTAPSPLVDLRGITKVFLGTAANDGVDFDVRPGEVHALLGENGAGKSTLMNVLCGLYRPDGGKLFVSGREVRFRSPGDAIAAGIGMVHQHFMLIPVQTVWENMILGQEGLDFVLGKRAICRRIAELADRYGLHVDPERPVWQLSIGEQQRVAILRMLYREAKVLILDEPTAVLTPQEARRLFETLTRMKAEGHGIVFISHKLDEVAEIADRVTILRRGRKIGTVSASGVGPEELAEMMIGSPVPPAVNKRNVTSGEVLLRAEGICARGDKDLPVLHDLSLSLRRGEILGLAGVDGNGQTELCEALVGLRPLTGGSLFFGERDMTGASVRDSLVSGIRYIPADRRGTGLVPTMNLRENYALRHYWRRAYGKGPFLAWEALAGQTGRVAERFDVVSPSLGIPVRMLSGGNLQKLMLARELDGEPQVVVAMQPTWGLDVGATAFVRERLLDARSKGAAVFLVSEDLEELLALSDRLAVIHKGRLMGLLDDPRKATEEMLGLMMAGRPLESLKEEACDGEDRKAL